MKTIKINHIGKTEGHLSFVGALLHGDFAEARIITEEGGRLIEGILLGRDYFEAPIITARICGVCPIVHNLASVVAMEQALNIKVTPAVKQLREILLYAQWIHSHALHAFFLSFPDLVGVNNNLDLTKKYPAMSALALAIRDFGVKLAKTIGGRTVHPINSVVGGFNCAPDTTELKNLLADSDEIMEKTEKLAEFVFKYRLPEFVRPANYVSLNQPRQYAAYQGQVHFFDNKENLAPDKFLYEIREQVFSGEAVKRADHGGREVMMGALARINNNHEKLNTGARRLLARLPVQPPIFNPFYNIYCQIIEIAHSVEAIKKTLKSYLSVNPGQLKLKTAFKPNAGRGFACVEAPRGLLYHEYELDQDGRILHANIIPPTALFLANLERDLRDYLPQIAEESEIERERLIKTLIRAYDPCISCATH